uniref:Uncharacterized protein n=1 Tax=Anguilla anguilla TaxID=7936 RepID=A0A0E9U4V7_ANGAN
MVQSHSPVLLNRLQAGALQQTSL